MNLEQARRLARLHLDVAHALYRGREQMGLSVETVAERAGLTPDRVIVIEEGDTTSLTEVVQLCDAIGITVASVFPGPPGQGELGEREEPRVLRMG